MFNKDSTLKESVSFFSLPPQSGLPEDWRGWDNTRKAHIYLLEESILNAPPYDDKAYSERGIVTCASAKRGMSSGKYLSQGHLPSLYCQLKELRRLRCTLPVCVAYLGDEEIDYGLIKLLTPLNVTFLDLTSPQLRIKMRVCNGWESKICAILNSTFEQVLFLDADNFPVLNPTCLFDTPEFIKHGGVLWPDLPPNDRTCWLPKEVWENVGLPDSPNTIDAESGQVLINKKVFHKQCQAIKCLNEHSEYVYKWVFGDKSTFLLGSDKVKSMTGDIGYFMSPHYCDWASKSILQKDFEGNVMFNHCVQNKPTLKGFPYPKVLLNREYLEAHVKELASLWDGELWEQLTVSEDESIHLQDLMNKRWVYQEEGQDDRQLAFLSESRVGKGLSRKLTKYGVFCDKNSPPKLIIKGVEGEVTVSLIKQENGNWEGVWVTNRVPVRLTQDR